jgi:hypothetical protein
VHTPRIEATSSWEYIRTPVYAFTAWWVLNYLLITQKSLNCVLNTTTVSAHQQVYREGRISEETMK